jgi:hypothetical protein
MKKISPEGPSGFELQRRVIVAVQKFDKKRHNFRDHESLKGGIRFHAEEAAVIGRICQLSTRILVNQPLDHGGQIEIGRIAHITYRGVGIARTEPTAATLGRLSTLEYKKATVVVNGGFDF